MKECNTVKQSPLAGLAAYGGGSGSVIFGRKGVGGYTIERSLRFNSADNTSLDRSPSSAGNRRTFTFSTWIKKATVTDAQRVIFSAYGGSGNAYVSIDFRHDSPRFLGWNGSSVTFEVKATQVLRDPSAWYHIVWAIDTTQSTAANRAKLYINGVQVTDFQTASYPGQNDELYVNTTNTHRVGENAGTNEAELDGYLADVHFIDGTALDSSSFGETNSDGVWDPKEFTGSFGQNGFHLKFEDASSTFALGTDSSDNGNTFIANNFGLAPASVTPNQGFDVVTYTGTNSSQSITGLNFQPDFIWFKARSYGGSHALVDSVRGISKQVQSNTTNPESTNSAGAGPQSFDSNGFTLGTESSATGSTNGSQTYVAWCWKAGGTPSSNTEGTITSTVSANNTYGFSIINHVGTGAAGTFGHGLSSAPDFMIFKNRAATDNWFVWTRALNDTNTGAVLNSTNAFFTNGVQELNQTLPTDSVIHVGSNLASNGSGQNVITYAWTEVPGFSKFGKYVGNGSTNGPKVTLGFKPRFIMLRSTSGSRAFCIYDTARDTNTTNDNNLFANNNNQESSDSSHNITILDDGFQLATGSVNRNGNGETYIYMAFAQTVGDASGNDSLFDSPVNGTQSDTGAGGEVSGNYATFNPLNVTGSGLSNGNLDLNGSSNFMQSTIMVDSGKYYFEFTKNGNGDNQFGIGYGGNNAGSTGFRRVWRDNNGSPVWLTDGSNAGSGTALSCAVGDVIGVALDMDNNAVYFSKNGTYMNSGAPSSGSSKTGAIWTDLSGQSWGPNAGSNANGVDCSLNTGQRPFAYSAPSGFVALCTTNLPDPTIADGSNQFETKIWTGNSTSTTLTTGFGPDWVWLKSRSSAFSHYLGDTVRGKTKLLQANSTAAQITSTTGITAFNSNSVTLGSGSETNLNNDSMAAWIWNAGANSNKTYAVKVVSDSGNKYRFDDFGTSAVTLDLAEGSTYIFDQSDSSNSGHPLRFSTTSNGTHGGGTEYTTGVTVTGTPGQAGAKTTIVVAASAPTLYYYCSVHSGMGGQANTNSTAGSSNFDGSIQATVKTNQTAGFSIVKAPITSSGGTIGHGLNASPGMLILKNMESSATNWVVWHSSFSTNDYILLNSGSAKANSVNLFNGTSNTTFTVGNGFAAGTADYICYCFAPVAGYSAFGSYTGNGSTDGPFLYTGFRPAFLLVRSSSLANKDWYIYDSARATFNVIDIALATNNNNAEVDPTSNLVDFVSNGIKLRGSVTFTNQSGESYIYAAFAENPFKTARAR